jgi:hypothetical protein
VVVQPEDGLVVTALAVVHSVTISFVRSTARDAGAATSARDESKCCKYSGGGQVTGGSFTPLSLET